MGGRLLVRGKRRSVYGETRKAVAGKLAEALPGKDDARVFVPSNSTVGEFFADYDDVARDTMKRRSLETYRDVARLHLLPAFGTKKLKDLSREHVQRLYSRKREGGLSAARVRRIHGLLSAALNTAVKWRYIEQNVCKEVSPPIVTQPEIRPLSLEEAKRFLASGHTPHLHLHPVVGRRQPQVRGYADGLEQRGFHAGELREVLAGMGRQRRDGRGTDLSVL